ncbi:hypothetical protein B0H13DRAFT_105915 [Mycena leptocephala]|nr:hypothetical protein B0H13DRAFT_105915 [Mycena leptocephala]
MIESIKKMYCTAGLYGLFDGISGTWLHQMSYSMCRFWAYDESKKFLGAGKDVPAWELALAGSMAGGIAGFVGSPSEIVIIRLQGDFAKPPQNGSTTRTALMRCFVCISVSPCLRPFVPHILPSRSFFYLSFTWACGPLLAHG